MMVLDGLVSIVKEATAMTASVAFDTTVTATGNNTGIVVPDEIIERLGAAGGRASS